MASITVSGLGSGLDVNGLVEQLVAADGAPTTARLDLEEAELQAKLSSYGTLKGALSSFQGIVSGLASLTSFNTKKIALSDSDLFSATATSIASPGGHSVQVTQLAQAHTLVTPAGAYSAVTDVIGTGTLTFRFGTTDYVASPESYNSFTPNPAKPSKQVTITDGSLQGIRDAVNGADIGVTASIIDDGSGYRLLFASEGTGAKSSLEVTGTGALSALDFNAANTNMEQTLAGQDAALTVDGLSITRASNTVTGAIHGVTLNLLSSSAIKTIQVTVANDTASVTSKVEGFVDAYNDVIEMLDEVTGYDTETGAAGVLIGDATVRGIATQMRRIVNDAVTGLTGAYTSLAAMGIATQPVTTEQADGTIVIGGSLVLDSGKLQTALSDDPDAVASLFALAGTSTDSLVNYLSATSSTKAGTYAVEVTTLATQGSYAGDQSNNITNITLTSGNKTFALNVDGVQSSTITLTEGTYDTDQKLATLAAEMQGVINADTALKNAGISVAVTYNTTDDRFVITSNTYGSSSKVSITSTNGTLGLDNGTATVGTDIVGNIGGVAATGAGRVLSGAGNAAGLQVEVIGGSSGLRGSVSVTRGYGDQLNTLLAQLLDDESALKARIDGAEDGIDGIDAERADLATRLAALEDRYRAQFTALDVLLTQMQMTSNYLTQQLAMLPGSSS